MSDVADRLDRVESLVEQQQETIEQQRERLERQTEHIEQQAEVIERLRADDEIDHSDDSLETEASISRRGAMKAAGLVGLLGAGAGATSAGPSIGEPGNQVETLYTQGLAGDLTGGTTVTDLVGAGLTVNNGSLDPALSSDLTLSNGDIAVDVGPGDIGAASDSHGNEAHSSTFATSGEVPDSPGDIGAASNSHGNGAHSTNFISSLSGGAGINQGSIGNGDTIAVDWSDANDLDGSGKVQSVPAVWSSGNGNLSVSGDDSAVFSGDNNSVTGSLHSVIVGGLNNDLNGPNQCIIGAGNDNFINKSTFQAGILAGRANSVEAGTNKSIICGGDSNTNSGSFEAFIGAGNNNTLDDANDAFIGAGNNNTVTDNQGGVITGEGEEISALGTIVGGHQNAVDGPMAGVLNGSNNTAAGAYATVPGGANNDVRGAFSLAFGNNATVETDGTVALADASDAEFAPDDTGLHTQMAAYAPEVNRVVSTPERDRASIDGETALDSLAGVDVSTGEDGLVIDPEGFNEAFDLDGDGLGTLDVDAALVAAVQALAAEVERLRQDSETAHTSD